MDPITALLLLVLAGGALASAKKAPAQPVVGAQPALKLVAPPSRTDGSQVDFANRQTPDGTTPTPRQQWPIGVTNLKPRPLGLAPQPVGAMPVPKFDDQGQVAQRNNADSTTAVSAAIVKDIPGAAQLFNAIGFSLTGADNGAALSPKEYAYVMGGAQGAMATGVMDAGGSGNLAAVQAAVNGRLNAVEKVDGSKPVPELTPTGAIDNSAGYSRVGGGYQRASRGGDDP